MCLGNFPALYQLTFTGELARPWPPFIDPIRRFFYFVSQQKQNQCLANNDEIFDKQNEA